MVISLLGCVNLGMYCLRGEAKTVKTMYWKT